MKQKNLWNKIWWIFDNEEKTNPQYLIAQEIIFRVNNKQRLNISEIAKETYTSKPTITRFAQSFGFEGFKDFAASLLEEENFYFFSAATKTPQISYDDYLVYIKELLEVVNEQKDTIIKIAKVVQENKKIFIFTSPENALLGNMFAQKLQHLGIEAHCSVDNKLMLMLNTIHKDDLAFFLVSGYSNSSLIHLWEYVNSFTKTILIATKSQMIKFPDPQLKLSLELNSFVLYDQVKTFLFIYVLDQIYNILVNNNQKLIDIFMSPKYRL